MAKFDLNKYEDQAKLSIGLGAVAMLAALVSAAAIMQKFDWSTFALYYGSKGLRMPVILGAAAAGCMIGAIGFIMGLRTAGQKRNKQARLSWIGFFTSAAAITLGACAGIFFWIVKIAQ